ncbi:MAG: hypothetical protein KJZ86_27865 [Caldilineaceae bacterium]|nr:hypothetical protein [Caldilineaceae bacterium]
MATYTIRVQTMLTEDQHNVLMNCAQRAQKPVGVLVREAVQKVYLQDVERERRQQALNRLAALNGPVSDWEEMEEEIIQAAIGG